jgi:threonine synthase
VLEIRGSFDDALRLAIELGRREGFVLVNSASPDHNRLAGQKLVAHEIVEQLGAAPDVILPYGGGGNVRAVARPTRAGRRRGSSSARLPSGRRHGRRRSESPSRRTPRRSSGSLPRTGSRS